MPRKRMIDPSFWDDLNIAKLSRSARLCFLGMMSNADDEGRIEADPRYIKRAVFGFDDDLSSSDVADLLAEIETNCPSVVFYEVDGRALVAFINWKRYQYIQKAQPSKLPPAPLPYQYDTATVPVSPNRIEKNRKERNRNDDDVKARLQAIFENPSQVATVVTAAAKRGGFCLADVELCEAWLKANPFDKNIGTLYNILKAGKLPTPSRAIGTQNGTPQPTLTQADVDRNAAAMIESDPELAALIAEIRNGSI